MKFEKMIKKTMKNRPYIQCSKCKHTLTFENYKKITGGRCPKCRTVFFMDKWKKQEHVIIRVDGKTNNVLVSTVHIVINHGFGDKNIWYETMLFPTKGKSPFEERYETEEEAIRGHKKTVSALKEGKFTFKNNELEVSK